MSASPFPMLDVFRQDVESQVLVLTGGLLALERDPHAAAELDACMRAAHSLKGAARIVGLPVAVRVAHAMEDCLVAAQQGRLEVTADDVDRLLGAVDLLSRIAETPAEQMETWTAGREPEVEATLSGLDAVLERATAPAPQEPPARDAAPAAAPVADRVLQVTAEHLKTVLDLAGESLVESRWVAPFTASLLRVKRLQQHSARLLDDVRASLTAADLDDRVRARIGALQQSLAESQEALTARLAELERFEHRSSNLAHRLYDAAVAARMRPFADVTTHLPRLARDLARDLGKEVRFEVAGESTQVDRDILAQLEAPLGHLIRNALDHGIETPDDRRAAGKPPQGLLQVEARHAAGTLQVAVHDDGRGIDLERLRASIVDKALIGREAAQALTEPELLEFLFLPGFSLKEHVTDISGRGVGLDAVRDMVSRVRGTIRISSERAAGTRVLLQLPVTLSTVRALLVEVGGEPYAIPLAQITRALKLPVDSISVLEGRQHFELDGQRIGLVAAHQVLDVDARPVSSEQLPVVALGDATHTYGLIVERFIGERELIVQSLEDKIGKIPNISAGALMDDGTPVLLVDVDDVIQSIDRLISGGRLSRVQQARAELTASRKKRVLVVEDSLTVRELERKLLGMQGYDVEVAVDGMDGWNVVRTGSFDLVVTDVDMPRMDGIELVRRINSDPALKAIPVMIVSYKDREEDRVRGLDAGAAYYLTKGSFHDETLIQAVVDLIGPANP
jgi:two-component system, chemotaxis family, sensor histidine kinase and response regulator WspE